MRLPRRNSSVTTNESAGVPKCRPTKSKAGPGRRAVHNGYSKMTLCRIASLAACALLRLPIHREQSHVGDKLAGPSSSAVVFRPLRAQRTSSNQTNEIAPLDQYRSSCRIPRAAGCRLWRGSHCKGAIQCSQTARRDKIPETRPTTRGADTKVVPLGNNLLRGALAIKIQPNTMSV
jgi:hypothetical protein